MSKRYADYRAKTYHSDKWLYGYKVGSVGNVRPHLVVDGDLDDSNRLDYEAYPCVQDTLCRNSHVADAGNVPIYENDILLIQNDSINFCEYCVVRFGAYATVGTEESYNLGFYLEWPEDVHFLRNEFLYWTTNATVRVVGNSIDDGITRWLGPNRKLVNKDEVR